ncbi:hypothetical protein SH2C18_21200 [Clostridium sediminicola]|uniref:hypothetical protein n=1 Tax=Clostridium sediminicola TaxID=3114879 RepID=UPI0031F261E2
MVSFKKMWDDVWGMITNGSIQSLDVVKEFNYGIIINDNEGNQKFITKDDFRDFWCKMLFFNEVSRAQSLNEEKQGYVYEVIKQLPYITENSNILTLKVD